MSDTSTTTEQAPPTADELAAFRAWQEANKPAPEPERAHGVEGAVQDLLSRLRLDFSGHHLSTVLDWLDSHGVLDAVDASGNKPPAEVAAETPASPTAETVAGGVAAEGGASSPIASGESTAPAAAPSKGGPTA